MKNAAVRAPAAEKEGPEFEPLPANHDAWDWVESVIADSISLSSLQVIIYFEAFIIMGLIVLLVFSAHAYGGQLISYALIDKDKQALHTEYGMLGGPSNQQLRANRLLALDRPITTHQSLLSWTSSVTTDIMTFGFNNFEQRMLSNREHFTARGWDSFVAALRQAGVYTNVVKKRQIVTAAPLGAPVITRIQMVDDRLQWMVQIPYMVTYQSGMLTDVRTSTLTLLVVQVPPSESLSGYGIDQWKQ